MFLDGCCCRSRKGSLKEGIELNNQESHTNQHSTPISVISNGSIDKMDSKNSSPVEFPRVHRQRTETQSSIQSAASMFSIASFYSTRSSFSRNGDGDFYSICSDDSFKST